MTTELLEHCLQQSTHRYWDLQRRHGRELRAGDDVTLTRQRMLFYAAEIQELRWRLAGGIPNLCY